jgi:hypothetical protein
VRIGPPDPRLLAPASTPAPAPRASAPATFAGVLAATAPRDLREDAAALRSAAVEEAGVVRGRHNARVLSELGPALREAQIELPWLCECADEWCASVVRSTASAYVERRGEGRLLATGHTAPA